MDPRGSRPVHWGLKWNGVCECFHFLSRVGGCICQPTFSIQTCFPGMASQPSANNIWDADVMAGEITSSAVVDKELKCHFLHSFV